MKTKDNHGKLPNNVRFLGLVSFFNDTASEMLYPVMPVFLTQVLGAPIYVVGIIEGVAEASASIFKTVFGYWSDKMGRRKPFIFGGYLASAISKIIIALSYSWPVVLLGRFTDRFGKGLRTGARDAMLLDAADSSNRGYIFGFHRSMDTAGAVFGPLIAIGILNLFPNNLRLILYIASIPAFLALVFFIFLKEVKTTKEKLTRPMSLSLSYRTLPTELKVFILGLAVFSLGNSSDAFLILRSKDLGLTLTLVISAYVLYNLVYALTSIPAGKIADKLGAKKVFILGILIFTLVYLGFAINGSLPMVWILFAVYGFYMALTDGVSKSIIGSYVSSEIAGTAYGVTNTITSLCTLIASVIAGFLWSAISPQATFIFGAVCALASLVIFGVVKNTKKPSQTVAN